MCHAPINHISRALGRKSHLSFFPKCRLYHSLTAKIKYARCCISLCRFFSLSFAFILSKYSLKNLSWSVITKRRTQAQSLHAVCSRYREASIFSVAFRDHERFFRQFQTKYTLSQNSPSGGPLSMMSGQSQNHSCAKLAAKWRERTIGVLSLKSLKMFETALAQVRM